MFTALTCPRPKIGLSLGGSEIRPRTGGPTNRRKWLSRLVVSLGALVGGGFVWWDRSGPQVPTEIFNGITYGCERLEATGEGSGLLHWVRIDLTAPDIELYVTPLDASAIAQGWQYRLRQIKDIVDGNTSPSPSTRPCSRQIPVGGRRCPEILPTAWKPRWPTMSSATSGSIRICCGSTII